MNFREINVSELKDMNVFNAIGKDWALLTSGGKEKLNTMTISWGGMGVLWNKNVSFVFVRPQRYTLEFLENNDYYTLSFLESGNKDILSFCGTHSGKDVDKIKETGLKVLHDKAPYFEQSKLVLICKKIYSQYMNKDCFEDESLQVNYKNDDYHKVFVGEIVKCLIRK